MRWQSALGMAVREPRRALAGAVCYAMRWPIISDATALRIMFRLRVGRSLDLERPSTFNAKLQWLKLHDRNPVYSVLVDKVAVKEWVAERIGRQHLVPTLACWENVDDISLVGLPERFVLKANHDSGSVEICRDKELFDLSSAKRRLSRSLRRNFFYVGREWPYKNVKPRVFAESYVEALGGEGSTAGQIDYKFYCFSGRPRFLYVSRGLENHHTAQISFLDMDWTFAPFSRRDYASFDELPPKPRSFEAMADCARTLSEGFPFVRVDFFEGDGEYFFSEMTFHPCSGFMQFNPEYWDRRIGDMLVLPKQGGEIDGVS